jgi:hypothetical protein
MVPIPYALTTTVTVEGRIPKLVLCEQCGEQFVYLLKRQAQGEGTSLLFLDNDGAKHRAEGRAQEALIDLINRAHDPIPCPQCGRIQTNMIPRAKRLHRKKMGQAGVICLIVAIIVFVLGFFVEATDKFGERTVLILIFYGSGIGMVLLGLTLLIRRKILARRFDPNDGPVEGRLEFARTVAMRLADWEKRPASKDKSPIHGTW